jgi:hypothetical protein
VFKLWSVLEVIYVVVVFKLWSVLEVIYVVVVFKLWPVLEVIYVVVVFKLWSVLEVIYVDHYLSFCHVFVGHCIVCLSSNNGFWFLVPKIILRC